MSGFTYADFSDIRILAPRRISSDHYSFLFLPLKMQHEGRQSPSALQQAIMPIISPFQERFLNVLQPEPVQPWYLIEDLSYLC